MTGHVDDPIVITMGYDGVEMDGCHYGSKEDAVGIGILGMCGCSDTDSAVALVGDFLRRVAVEKVYAYDYFEQFGLDPYHKDEHRALVDIFLGVLERADITEHGTSGRRPWLTGKGESLYALMGWGMR